LQGGVRGDRGVHAELLRGAAVRVASARRELTGEEQQSWLDSAESWLGEVTGLVEEGAGIVKDPVGYAKSFLTSAFKSKVSEVKSKLKEKTLYLYLVDEFSGKRVSGQDQREQRVSAA